MAQVHSVQQVYTTNALDACLKFVSVAYLDDGKGKDDSADSPEWWPCLWFADAMELHVVTRQWNLCRDITYQRAVLMEYTRLFPQSACCPVALLLGERPPVRCIFDVPSRGATPLTVLPLIEHIYSFNVKYLTHQAYIQAVSETLPIQMIIHDEDKFPESKEQANPAMRPNSTHNDPPAVVVCSDTSTVSSKPLVAVKTASKPGPSKTNETNKRRNARPDATTKKKHPHSKVAPASRATDCHKAEENEPEIRTLRSMIEAPLAEKVVPEYARRTSPRRDDKTTNKASTESSSLPEDKRPKSTPSKATKESPTATLNGSSSKRKHTTVTKTTPSTSAKKAKPGVLINVECPSWSTVHPILTKGGYKFPTGRQKGARFCLPSGEKFASENLLRNNLCAYGVQCKCGEATENILVKEDDACSCWTSDDKWTIKLWVRYDVIGGSLSEGDVHEITEIVAWGYLQRLGFTQLKSFELKSYALPGVQKACDGKLDATMFNFKRDMWKYLSRFGLPSYCDFDELTEDERFELEYFLSTNYHRANTFTRIPKMPPSEEMNWTTTRTRKIPVGPTSVDMVDEGATVVSISSGFSSEPLSTKKQKKAVSYTRDNKQPGGVKESVAVVESPSRSSSLPYTSTSENAQHVSPSTPFFARTKELPRYEGTDQEKLSACLDALNSPDFSGNPTIVNDKSSAFASKIRSVSEFLQAVIGTDGRNGGRHGNDERAAALYVCGAPGLGKTSGVKWCCTTAAQKYSKRGGPVVKICELNASVYTSSVDPMQSFLDEISKFTHLKASSPQQSSIEKALTRLRDKPNKNLLIVVIDEIDALASSQGASSLRGQVLETMLRWAHDPDMQVAVIGISNCMNDENFNSLFRDGMFKESVTFASYNENELKNILQARVGTAIFANNALDFIAKKVASSSGDARAALEMAKRAVRFRLVHTIDNDSSTGPIVLIPHVVQSNKDETANVKDRIAGLPLIGKAMLCVLMTFAQGGAVECTLAELKSCVGDCLRRNGSEDDMLSLEDFLILLETLVESGLLLASSRRNRGGDYCLSNMPMHEISQDKIRLGLQLDEVQKALEVTLNQGFYQNLRETAEDYRRESRD